MSELETEALRAQVARLESANRRLLDEVADLRAALKVTVEILEVQRSFPMVTRLARQAIDAAQPYIHGSLSNPKAPTEDIRSEHGCPS